MIEFNHMLITWTTYGTWLPGDGRGWRRRGSDSQLPQPLLEQWCRAQMSGKAVLLRPQDRQIAEEAIREHCQFRNWVLHATIARTNHVHLVVSSGARPETVRDQLKANCTRRLRQQTDPLVVDRTWSRGGDCQLLDSENDVEAAVIYVTEAQERKSHSSN